VNERRARRDARRRETDDEGGETDRSTLAIAVDTVRRWLVAAWVRAVGVALWAVTGLHLGVLLDAADVPVVGTARALLAGLPFDAAVGSAGATLLVATVAAPLGVAWTLRWDGDSRTHHRRVLALVLLVVLPFVLSAVEMAILGLADAALGTTVAAPASTVRAFYHVTTTLAIAFGAAHLWYRMHTQHVRGHWRTY
jgi:predicted secreted protein